MIVSGRRGFNSRFGYIHINNTLENGMDNSNPRPSYQGVAEFGLARALDA